MLGRFLGIFPRDAQHGATSETGSRDTGILPHPGDRREGGSGSRKGHSAEGLEALHIQCETSSHRHPQSLWKQMALPQGRVLAQGTLF